MGPYMKEGLEGLAETGLWRQVARAAKGFMPDPEGMALHEAAYRAAASGLGPIVEIGTYCAKSAIYLGAGARRARAEAAANSGPDNSGPANSGPGRAMALVFSIDHHRGSEELQAGWPDHDPEVVDPLSGAIDTLPWARRALAEAGLEDAVVLVVGESAVVAGAWSTPLAMLFIDGGHGEDVAWSDYRSWAPKLAPGGALAIHDVFADPADGGQAPYHLYMEALRSGQFSEQGAVGSLRLLRRDRHPPGQAGVPAAGGPR